MNLGVFADIASILGLVITLVGFVATLRNVRKARQAAEEAKEAARKTMERVSERLVGEDLATTIHHLNDLRAACRERSWDVSVLRVNHVSIRLSQLLPHPVLTHEERDDLAIAVEDLQTLQKAIDRSRRSASPKGLPTSQVGSLDRALSLLGRVRGRILSKAFEV